ncbi:MAG: SDR family oxidoreductase [Candidatus Saganbacteria bacterium]|nr:SDR family oxidoreductase [Candidatus Saganbacteria bacterium]
MKILVVGASGFIGNILYDSLSRNHETIGTFCQHPSPGLIHLDITSEIEVGEIFDKYKPSVVFQPAALGNANLCEENRDRCFRVNFLGTKNLVGAAKKINSKFVYFSSDYIFDGKNGPYGEGDRPNPICNYGEAKLASERLIQEQLQRFLIIRTTVVYGWERAGKNFVVNLINNLSNNKTLKVPYDQIGSPTYAPNLVEVVEELVLLKKVGIYNVVGEDLMDRYAFSQFTAEVFGLDKQLLLPVSTTELKQPCPRPLRAGMKIDKVKNEIKTRLVGVREGLKLMRKERQDIHE